MPKGMNAELVLQELDTSEEQIRALVKNLRHDIEEVFEYYSEGYPLDSKISRVCLDAHRKMKTDLDSFTEGILKKLEMVRDEVKKEHSE